MWFAGYLADEDRSGWIILEDGRPVGSMMLEGVKAAQKRSKLSWYIGEAASRGRGTSRAALALGLDAAHRGSG